MEAKKMFEELGFIESKNEKNCSIEYTLVCETALTVSFIIRSKRYLINEICPVREFEDCTFITIALHKAITQQLKELGWLND